MLQLSSWCVFSDVVIGDHNLYLVTGDPNRVSIGVEKTARIVPDHYLAEERVARTFDRLGKSEVASLIRDRLPMTKNLRSGDLGEIYATEWINAHSSGYNAPVKRLRWRDHRNMAMRGDDVIGIRVDPQSNRVFFLKTESKSRRRLTNTVLVEARAGLDKYDGLPSAHSLAFIADRLFELGDLQLADLIDEALLKYGISINDVKHLIFTFSENCPKELLTSVLQNYQGEILQWGVGFKVDRHEEFVNAVYDQVIANADHT